jgi:hypothetical protein
MTVAIRQVGNEWLVVVKGKPIESADNWLRRRRSLTIGKRAFVASLGGADYSRKRSATFHHPSRDYSRRQNLLTQCNTLRNAARAQEPVACLKNTPTSPVERSINRRASANTHAKASGKTSVTISPLHG